MKRWRIIDLAKLFCQCAGIERSNSELKRIIEQGGYSHFDKVFTNPLEVGMVEYNGELFYKRTQHIDIKLGKKDFGRLNLGEK